MGPHPFLRSCHRFKSTDRLQILHRWFSHNSLSYSAPKFEMEKIDDVKGWVNNSIGKNMIIFFSLKIQKNQKMHWICPTDIPFMVSHTPMKYYNVLYFIFFYTENTQWPFLIKRSQHQIYAHTQIKYELKQEKLGSFRILLIVYMRYDLKWQQAMLQSACWLVRKVWTLRRKIPPEYTPKAVPKTIEQKCLFYPGTLWEYLAVGIV